MEIEEQLRKQAGKHGLEFFDPVVTSEDAAKERSYKKQRAEHEEECILENGGFAGFRAARAEEDDGVVDPRLRIDDFEKAEDLESLGLVPLKVLSVSAVL